VAVGELAWAERGSTLGAWATAESVVDLMSVTVVGRFVEELFGIEFGVHELVSCRMVMMSRFVRDVDRSMSSACAALSARTRQSRVVPDDRRTVMM
jgi:hypothetical protein